MAKTTLCAVQIVNRGDFTFVEPPENVCRGSRFCVTEEKILVPYEDTAAKRMHGKGPIDDDRADTADADAKNFVAGTSYSISPFGVTASNRYNEHSSIV